MVSISIKKTLQAANDACFTSLSSDASNIKPIHFDRDSICYPIHGVKTFQTSSVSGKM